MSAALRAYADRQAAATAKTAGADSDVAADASAMDSSAAGGSDDTALAAPLVGKAVVLSGLLSRPDLNGKVGDALDFDISTGRYTVTVNGESLALRSSNLTVQRSAAGDSTAFAGGTRIRIKGLSAKPELNECGGKVLEWNAEKERFVVELDGSLRTILLRAQNLERDRRERWEPEMHTTENLAHIQQEMHRYIAEQNANANPFASMDPTGELFKNKDQAEE